MNLELVRFAYSKYATLGFLYAGDLRLATLEEPWRADPDGPGGQRRQPGLPESCVPDGLYVLEPHDTPRFQNVFALVNPALGVYHWNVPPLQNYGRTAILIHAGNSLLDTEGCILVGRTHTRLEDQDRVTESRVALDSLRTLLGKGTHQLKIRSTAGTSEVRHV